MCNSANYHGLGTNLRHRDALFKGDEFGLISSNSSMFGRYSIVEEFPLGDLVKSPLRGGKGEWSITMRFFILVRDFNMLAANSWVIVTLKVHEM
jgi:hypothetical protein